MDGFQVPSQKNPKEEPLRSARNQWAEQHPAGRLTRWAPASLDGERVLCKCDLPKLLSTGLVSVVRGPRVDVPHENVPFGKLQPVQLEERFSLGIGPSAAPSRRKRKGPSLSQMRQAAKERGLARRKPLPPELEPVIREAYSELSADGTVWPHQLATLVREKLGFDDKASTEDGAPSHNLLIRWAADLGLQVEERKQKPRMVPPTDAQVAILRDIVLNTMPGAGTGRTCGAAAAQLGVTYGVARRWMGELGLDPRSDDEKARTPEQQRRLSQVLRTLPPNDAINKHQLTELALATAQAAGCKAGYSWVYQRLAALGMFDRFEGKRRRGATVAPRAPSSSE